MQSGEATDRFPDAVFSKALLPADPRLFAGAGEWEADNGLGIAWDAGLPKDPAWGPLTASLAPTEGERVSLALTEGEGFSLAPTEGEGVRLAPTAGEDGSPAPTIEGDSLSLAPRDGDGVDVAGLREGAVRNS